MNVPHELPHPGSLPGQFAAASQAVGVGETVKVSNMGQGTENSQ